MIQPKSLYRLVKRTARLQGEASGVLDVAQHKLDMSLLVIWDTLQDAAAHKDTYFDAPDESEGLRAGKRWWAKWQEETDSGDGVAVYLCRSLNETRRGRVAVIAKTVAQWLSRVGWVRKPTDAEIEAERALATATVHPRVITDIGGRLRTARSLHHALPDGQRSVSTGHPPRRKGRKRVPAH